MTRQELIIRLSEKSPFFLSDDAGLAVDLILNTLVEAMAQNRRVEIRGFGSFVMTKRGERIARNPQTGEKVVVPAKSLPHFKPGKELREAVAKEFGQPIR